MVIVHRVDRSLFGCGIAVSLDSEATWRQSAITTPPGKSISCFAPDASFSPDGVVYISFTSFASVPGHGDVPDAVWVAKSTDGGNTVQPPAMVSGPLAFQVRVAADTHTPGHAIVTWVQAAGTTSNGFTGPGNPIVVSRTSDGGTTWDSPTQSVPPGGPASSPVPMSGDYLYVAYLDVGDDRIDYEGGHEGQGAPPYPGPWSLVLARSADGGATWQDSVVDEHIAPAQRFLQLFPLSPSLATHGKMLCVAYSDARLGDADIYVWHSTDGGVRWSAPKRVNDTRSSDGLSQYLPAVDTAPNGQLDVVYYDRRADPKDVLNEVSLQSSTDGGSTFTPRVRLSDRSFDSRVGLGTDQNIPDLGSRLGILSAQSGALAIWCDTRDATNAIHKSFSRVLWRHL